MHRDHEYWEKEVSCAVIECALQSRGSKTTQKAKKLTIHGVNIPWNHGAQLIRAPLQHAPCWLSWASCREAAESSPNGHNKNSTPRHTYFFKLSSNEKQQSIKLARRKEILLFAKFASTKKGVFHDPVQCTQISQNRITETSRDCVDRPIGSGRRGSEKCTNDVDRRFGTDYTSTQSVPHQG